MNRRSWPACLTRRKGPDCPNRNAERLPDPPRSIRPGGWRDAVGTPGAHPGKPTLDHLQKLLAGREVVLAPHADADGRTWLADVGQRLLNAGCQVRYIPAAEGDLDDRLKRESDPAAALAELIGAERRGAMR